MPVIGFNAQQEQAHPRDLRATYLDLGFAERYPHPVGADDELIDVFGAKVLPALGSP